MKVNIITYNVNRRFWEAGRGGVLDDRTRGHPIPRTFFIFLFFSTTSSLPRHFSLLSQYKSNGNLLSFNILVTFVTFFENLFYYFRERKIFEIK